MFSFRTTPLDEQEDIVLRSGKVAVLCNQAAWNPEKEECSRFRRSSSS